MQDNNNLMFTWSKTLLGIYRYITTVCNAIDDLVIKQGVNSGFYGFGKYNSTIGVASKIIELTERKKKLIKINYLIEDCLANLKQDDMRLLTLVYIDMLKSVQVAEHLNMSIRTFFRRKNLAIEKIASVMTSYGYNHESLYKMLEGEGWLINIFNKNSDFKESQSFDDDKFDAGEYKLLKCIIKDLNNTKIKQYSY